MPSFGDADFPLIKMLMLKSPSNIVRTVFLGKYSINILYTGRPKELNPPLEPLFLQNTSSNISNDFMVE